MNTQLYDRKLALHLYSSGYQAGHNDTAEGSFSDDPRGDDAEDIHGEAVTELLADHEEYKRLNIPRVSNHVRMNTKELADELMVWLPKLSAGKTVQISLLSDIDAEVYHWHDITSIDDLVLAIDEEREVQLKPIVMPEPPEGEEWHNYHELDSNQIEIDSGWRLLLKSERDPIRERPVESIEIWNEAKRGWFHSDKGFVGGCELETYRVKAKKHPVGSLRAITPEQVRNEIMVDLMNLNYGIGSGGGKAIASAIFAGKVRHLEIKA